jgi:hypothetical protein
MYWIYCEMVAHVVEDYIFSIFRVEMGKVGRWYGHGSEGS